MKNIVLSFATFLLILSISACTVTKPAEPVREITVSGTGSVMVKPDLVALSFSIRTNEKSVVYASERNATLTTAVIKALQDAGISNEDISTSDYSIYQDNQPNMAIRYTVKNTISVLLRNPELTGKIIDTAVMNGANSLSSFEYLVSDKQSALRQARTLAIQNAQDAANLLAGASGCKVNTVMNIREDYISTSQERAMLKVTSMNDSAPVTPIEAGTVTVSSNVTITYSLE